MTRRRLLAAAGAVTATAATPRAAQGQVWRAPDPWPTAAHDLRGTRATSRAVWAPAERWRATLAGGVPGAAAVAGGTVYVAAYGGEVAALDLRTGRERWRRALPVATYGTTEMGFFAGPAVTADRVFCASDRPYALDRRTGAVVWTGEPLGADDYHWGPPVVVGSTVLVGSGSGSETPLTRGRLSAYDVRTGQRRWSTPTVPEGANGGGVIVPPTVDPLTGRLYVATGAPYEAVPGDNPGTSSLLELRARDGVVTWAEQVHPADTRGLDLNSAPVLLGPWAFVTAKDGIHAFDRRRRRRLWRVQLTPESDEPGGHSGPTNGPEFGPIATDGRRLYVLSNDSASQTAVAAALAPATGRVLWRTTVPGFVFAAPAIAGGELWTATASGDLHALRTRDGAIVATVGLGEPSAGAVSSSAGAVLAGTGAGANLPGESLVCVA